MKFINGLFIILFFIVNIYTQERKSIEAHRFLVPPTIDGNISENEWEQIKPATNFTLFQPEIRSGEKIPNGYETYVYFGIELTTYHSISSVGQIFKSKNSVNYTPRRRNPGLVRRPAAS